MSECICKDEPQYFYGGLAGILVFLLLVIIVLFSMLVWLRSQYKKQIKALEQQNSSIFNLRERNNMYEDTDLFPATSTALSATTPLEHNSTEEETEFNGDTPDASTDNIDIKSAPVTAETSMYSEIQEIRLNGPERYSDVTPVPSGTVCVGDEKDGIFGQFTTKPPPHTQHSPTDTDPQYSTPLPDARILATRRSMKRRKGSVRVLPPNYESIEERGLKVTSTPPVSDGDQDREEGVQMGIVTANSSTVTTAKHLKGKRSDYDDIVVMPPLPRSGSEVAKERRRIDLTSSQPVSLSSSLLKPEGSNPDPATAAMATYSSLVHMEMMKKRRMQDSKPKTDGAVYSTLSTVQHVS